MDIKAWSSQPKNAWELSDDRSSIPLENIKLESKIGGIILFYEANILSELIANKAVSFSFCDFCEMKVSLNFSFDEVYTQI